MTSPTNTMCENILPASNGQVASSFPGKRESGTTIHVIVTYRTSPYRKPLATGFRDQHWQARCGKDERHRHCEHDQIVQGESECGGRYPACIRFSSEQAGSERFQDDDSRRAAHAVDDDRIQNVQRSRGQRRQCNGGDDAPAVHRLVHSRRFWLEPILKCICAADPRLRGLLWCSLRFVNYAHRSAARLV